VSVSVCLCVCVLRVEPANESVRKSLIFY